MGQPGHRQLQSPADFRLVIWNYPDDHIEGFVAVGLKISKAYITPGFMTPMNISQKSLPTFYHLSLRCSETSAEQRDGLVNHLSHQAYIGIQFALS